MWFDVISRPLNAAIIPLPNWSNWLWNEPLWISERHEGCEITACLSGVHFIPFDLIRYKLTSFSDKKGKKKRKRFQQKFKIQIFERRFALQPPAPLVRHRRQSDCVMTKNTARRAISSGAAAVSGGISNELLINVLPSLFLVDVHPRRTWRSVGAVRTASSFSSSFDLSRSIWRVVKKDKAPDGWWRWRFPNAGGRFWIDVLMSAGCGKIRHRKTSVRLIDLR